jgi:hypothetical protein
MRSASLVFSHQSEPYWGTARLRLFRNGVNASYTAKYDGSPTEVTGSGAPYDSIAVKQVHADTFTYEARQTNGKYHASGRTVISRDGKTMTTTAKGRDANGAPMALTLVYEKQ